jgi:hypothetical protein
MLYDGNIFNQNQGADPMSVFSSANVDELIKAISAGQASGQALVGQLTSGGALKYESLEATLKNLTFQNKHFVFYNAIEKKPARSTNEEYNQLVTYGRSGKYGTLEGELPESVDTQYRRMSEFIKYKGIVGQVTDVIMQTNNQIDVYAQEVQSKMTLLLQSIEAELHYGDSHVDPLQFNGVYRLHKKLIAPTSNLDYSKSPFVLDIRGQVLQDAHINAVVSNVVNRGYGLVTDIFAPPSVFTDYVDQKYELRRIVTGAEVEAGKFGQKVTEFVTQFGSIMPNATIFGRRSVERYSGDGAQTAKSPASIVPDVGTPLAAVSDPTLGRFGSSYAGDYFVAVAAVNQYGEGPLVALSASAVTVSSTQSIDMKWSIVDNAYPATGYVIYRSEKDVTTALADTPLYPVFQVSLAEKAAGYDGAAAALVRDRNYEIPNTECAFLYEAKNADILAIKELGKMKKLDLAITSPTYRFAVLYYLTQILYAPYKLAKITNIGKVVPS